MYIQHLKAHYEKVAVIKKDYKGLFDVAHKKSLNNQRFEEQLKETKEIWFFFDTEQVNRDKWKEYRTIIEN